MAVLQYHIFRDPVMVRGIFEFQTLWIVLIYFLTTQGVGHQDRQDPARVQGTFQLGSVCRYCPGWKYRHNGVAGQHCAVLTSDE